LHVDSLFSTCPYVKIEQGCHHAHQQCTQGDPYPDKGFSIGPHKAYLISRDASKNRLMVYSELDERLAQALLLNPVKDLQSAVDAVLADLKPDERVGVLPRASSTIPYLTKKE
jgi:hypothetical protein